MSGGPDLTPAMKAVLPLLPEAPHPGVTIADITPVPDFSLDTVRMALAMCRRAGLVERVGYEASRSGPGGTCGIWRRIPAALVVPGQRRRLTHAMVKVLESLPVAPAPGVTVAELAEWSGYAPPTIRFALSESRRLGMAEQSGSVHTRTGRSAHPGKKASAADDPVTVGSDVHHRMQHKFTSVFYRSVILSQLCRERALWRSGPTGALGTPRSWPSPPGPASPRRSERHS